MAKPYATAIIPTLNRSTTLPVSLETVQKQSIEDLEIILVLDGATEACREIACASASEDSRIHILDLPKAPGHGERNIDKAVLASNGERIFYNDDDDIWLPHHVEVLGQLLDEADIVDSRVATANREYELHLGICPGSSPKMKELLATYRHKNLFDTHIAHRKDAYTKCARWVPDDGECKRPVWEFLKGFAENSMCRWLSTEQVTSISLHGANRRDMNSHERAIEIHRWQHLVQQPSAYSSLMTDAGRVFHLFRLLSDIPARDRNLEILSNGYEAYPDVVSSPVTHALCGLFSGEVISIPHAREILRHMCLATFVGYHTQQCVTRLLRVFGTKITRELVEDVLTEQGMHRTGALYAQAIIYRHEYSNEPALTSIKAACDNGPDPVGQLRKFRSSIEKSLAC